MWVPTRPAPSLPQARLAEAQAATARADRLQGESAELVRRIIEMKDREADRLNEMNRLHTETVGCVFETRGFQLAILAPCVGYALHIRRNAMCASVG